MRKGDAVFSVMEQKEFQTGETLAVENAAETETVPVAPAAEAPAEATERLPEEFLEKRRNGLSLAEALEVVRRGEDVPELELKWEKPLSDTENVRARKMKVAEDLAAAFPRARDALARASGVIAKAKWSQAWQREAEDAARKFSAAAETLGERAADFTAATGLLPLAGTLKELRALLDLVSALVAVRGEDAALVLAPDAAEKLAALRAAATLAENRARHESLLSLPYPPEASNDPRLEDLLKLWREAEISRTIPRWMKRHKVVRELRKLAGGVPEKPLDPRVDLGNLIAVRTCNAEFAEKFSSLAETFPKLLGGDGPSLARIEALEKARSATAAAFARLENFPEKLDAWRIVISRWLAGKNPDFAVGGSVEKTLAAAKSALGECRAARAALAEAAGTPPPESDAETAESAKAFADELLADRGVWRDVCAWNAAALAAERRGMSALAAGIRDESVPAERAVEFFETNYCRRWAKAVSEESGIGNQE